LTAAILALLLTAAATSAQDPPPGRPRYLPDAADEDWSFLKNAPRTDIWDPIKYIGLGREDWFMTLSGEIRYRPEGFRVRATDARPAIIDTYFLQRYLFGANVRFGTRARVFGELQSGIINGRLGSPRPTDQNSVDVHQAFFEWQQPVRESQRFSAKIGRQELAVGSTRLISASPGLNVKRSFDGAALWYRTPSWVVVGAVAELVPIAAGAFDDWPAGGQLFWGVAAGRRSPFIKRGELGVYYLGIDREESQYTQGVGSEVRHTAGVKWSGSGARLDLNYDGLFQWGTFIDGPIRAWGFATETGYRIISSGWKPRVSLRMDVASGDRDPADPQLQAFNPLFPGNSFSGVVGLFGPTNLTDLTPSVVMAPRQDLTIGVEAPSYWRTSTHDGVYATNLRLLIRPEAGTGKYVGTNPGIFVVWQATRHCQLQGAITRFLPGRFLDETFVSEGFGFYSVSAVYRF
jgi:Alginate export